MRSRHPRGRSRTAWLFEPGSLRLRPTGLARLRAAARRRRPPLGERQRQAEEDRDAMRRLRAWGVDLAARFGLGFGALEPERDGVNGHYGICYQDGLIRIRLRHATTGRLLKESSLVDTLCHELAHLRHFNHGPAFRRLYFRILAEARRLGFYRPGPQGDRRPRQATLFDDSACGV